MNQISCAATLLSIFIFNPLIVRCASGQDVGPPKGALVIVGGGGMGDDIRDRFIQLAGGKEARIAIVPTASSSNGDFEGSLREWRARGTASRECIQLQAW